MHFESLPIFTVQGSRPTSNLSLVPRLGPADIAHIGSEPWGLGKWSGVQPGRIGARGRKHKIGETTVCLLRFKSMKLS